MSEHRNDLDFFAKAHMYKTAKLVATGEYVSLLCVTDSDQETGVVFRATIRGRMRYINDLELADFVL